MVCLTYCHTHIHVQNGSSALMAAAMAENTDVVVELVMGGANMNLQNKVCYLTGTCTCTCSCSVPVNDTTPHHY